MRRILQAVGGLSLVLVLAGAVSARSLPAPADYGAVIMDNFSARAGIPPVRFDHWLHRSKFTCRVCHVDVGFAMEAKGTRITADMNMKGSYCGSCHNGRVTYDGEQVFAACSIDPAAKGNRECLRCHSVGSEVRRKYDYVSFAEKLPRQSAGDLVDWEKAEAQGLIRPADSVPGQAASHTLLKAQEDFSITSRGWMPDIVFSHKKHALWNGCEVCHPDIFPSVRKGAVRYSMFQIFEGEYCGLCHDRVAFPLYDCDKCHVDRVRR
jgi:c(7)-type cytochrome triheme protein